MHFIEILLLILFLVIISNIISHYFHAIPSSLIQIALGIIVGMSLHIDIKMDSSWFMIAFVAPILYNDGNRFPKKELWEMKAPIIANAVYLVLITTVVGGAVIHWLIPSMQWSNSFALAAVLSPTDPIAVQSIAEKVGLPSNLLHLVSGESLINDATGLICFKYGVAATVTGVFSLQHATLDFFYVAIGGLLFGIVAIWLINNFRIFIYNQGIDDVILHTLIQLGTPFIIYLIAEETFHISGVVSVVVAGILDISSDKRFAMISPELKLVSSKTWDVFVYAINGIVFVLLGMELPIAMKSLIVSHRSTSMAVFYAFLIWLTILFIRVVWSYTYTVFSKKREKISFRMALISGLTGVRGAVTMAGVMSIPLVLKDGSPFPDRNLMLFISSMVIIFSLLGASIFIPILSRKPAVANNAPDDDIDKEQQSEEQEEKDNENHISTNRAELYMTKQAIKKLESLTNDENQNIIIPIINEYRFLLRARQNDAERGKSPEQANQELDLIKVGIQGSKDKLEELYKNGKVGQKLYQRTLRRLNDLDLLASTSSTKKYDRKSSKKRFRIIMSQFGSKIGGLFKNKNQLKQEHEEQRTIEITVMKAGKKTIKDYLDTTEKTYDDKVISLVKNTYDTRIQMLNNNKTEMDHDDYEDQVNYYRTVAISEQRNAIQDMYEEDKISRDQANELRMKINYEEGALNIDFTD